MLRCISIISLGLVALGCQAPEGPDQRLGDQGQTTPISTDGGAAGDAGSDGVLQGSRDGGAGGATDGDAFSVAPPATWQEHWFEHVQLLKKVAETDDVAIYFDNDVNPAATSWIQPMLTSLWKYTKQTYGIVGDGRLFGVFHAGRYDGEHSASIFDATHDNRGVIDLGGTDPMLWSMPTRTQSIAYSIGRLVELSPLGFDTLPSTDLTTQQFGYFFAYDALKAVGMTQDADAWLGSLMTYSVDHPRTGTYWMRDWYYPLWQSYGGAAVFARFIRLCADRYPKVPRADGHGQVFAPAMNWGEYVHFMSGAAAADLKVIATKAFGWPDTRETEFQQAKRDFPMIKY